MSDFSYPADGPLSPGRILSDPFDPGSCLNPSGIVPISSTTPLQYQSVHNAKESAYSAVEGYAGLWATFSAAIVGVTIGANTKYVADGKWDFKTLETRFFDPSREYVERSMQQEEVCEWLRATKFKKEVYMVTGVKIAKGAKRTSTNWKQKGGNFEAGLSGEPAGVPSKIGPYGGGEALHHGTSSFEQAEDFVFAFRLREIFFEGGAVPKANHRKYNRGALMELESGNQKGKLEVEDESNWIAIEVELSEEDLDPETFGAESGIIHDDDEQVRYTVIKS
ncbi:MAG: hypothetical protein M1814_001358 [Vezdaea aestivalis]|nr:MAG: hypothetical protein M1814_001358 [Vezdaea aestivalis]